MCKRSVAGTGLFPHTSHRLRSLNVGALIIRIGFPLKGSFNGVYKGSIVGFFNIGALIIRIGCGGP